MKIGEINPYIRYVNMGSQRVINDKVRTYDQRLFYILAGDCDIWVEGRPFSLSAHTLVLLRSGTVYRFERAEAVQMIVFNFDYFLGSRHIKDVLRPVSEAEFMENKILESFEFEDLLEFNEPVVLENMHSFERELEEIVNTYRTPNLFHSELSSAQFKLFLCRVADRLAYETSEVHGIVDRALEYIDIHFCEEISNGDVAAHVGYHSYYLNRLMVSKTGKTIHRHITDRRLERACELIAENELSIGDISAALGFRNMTHFCNFFKQELGQTPTAFRKNYANKL